jgi:16S rRNA (guanine966-N2)-methyltransferase
MVREALFSILGESTVGSRFADLFAGSGIVGLEAASRGAAEVCWVEKDRRSCRELEKILAENEDVHGRVLCSDVRSSVKTDLCYRNLDIVFADPPYPGRGRDGCRKKGAGRECRSWEQFLKQALADFQVVRTGGLFIFETAASAAGEVREEDASAWTTIDIRRYGGTALVFYRHSREEMPGKSKG